MAAESKLQRYVMREIAKLGGWPQKFSSPANRGVPDLIILWDSKPTTVLGYEPYAEFIEMKAPGKKPTLLQLKDHERRRKMGFQVHVLGSEEQVEAYLKSRGKK